MSTTTFPRVAPAEAVASRSAAVPWYIWCAVFAVTSAMIGAHWDISWHSSIGRDTFWTPAHIAIYLCGLLSGISCGYLIFSTTLQANSPFRDTSVSVLGFRGPLGAFLSAWGGVTMLTSAPFDNWWHDTYGLDVKILSPPHVLLVTGVLAIELGTLILILGFMNRTNGEQARRLRWLFLYVGGMITVLMLVFTLEFTDRDRMHDSLFYRVIAIVVPPVFASVSRGSGDRWAATKAALVYTFTLLGLLWVLPLFPAEPKLGPVYQRVTHFIPVAGFPLLLVAPAMALDLLWSRLEGRSAWWKAALGGVVFVTVFLAVQWSFAYFLMSPYSRNWIFGTHYFGYYVSPLRHLYRNQFFHDDANALVFWTRIGYAVVFATIGTRVGLACGEWMRRVQR